MIQINNFDELIDFIENHDLTHKQISELVNVTLKTILINDYETKTEIVDALKNFWKQYGHTKERPVFIDLDISS